MSQFTGGAQIMQTMLETVQGVRIVKAFALEEQMRAKFDASVGTLERDSVKMARVSNRASPLMETLGGIAIALVVIYGGYLVIIGGATPGGVFTFIAALLLAYEPAQRLAQPHPRLTLRTVGRRLLFEVI